MLENLVDFLQDDDKVVGIVIDGKAKAYPIRILNWHEIVNSVSLLMIKSVINLFKFDPWMEGP